MTSSTFRRADLPLTNRGATPRPRDADVPWRRVARLRYDGGGWAACDLSSVASYSYAYESDDGVVSDAHAARYDDDAHLHQGGTGWADCVWAESMGEGDEVLAGNAADPSACVAMVRDACPSATVASLPARGSGQCKCRYDNASDLVLDSSGRAAGAEIGYFRARGRDVDVQRSDAAAATWTFGWALAASPRPRRGDSVERRRGRDVDIRWSGAAAATWMLLGALAATPRPRRGYSAERRRGRDVDIRWPRPRRKSCLARSQVGGLRPLERGGVVFVRVRRELGA